MPDIRKFVSIVNPKNIVLFIIFILMLGVLLFFINIRSTLISNTANNQFETIHDAQGNEFVLKHANPPVSDMPAFVVNNTAQMPEGFKADYNLTEYYGVRVVSTGKFSTSVIKDRFGFRSLGKVLQLEVKVDDQNNYLDKNEPFNIALRIYPDPNVPSKDIAPQYLMNIIQEQESDRIGKDLSASSIEERTAQLDEVMKQYVDKGISQEKLDQLFKEGTVWIMVPYVEDDLIQYTLNNKESVNHEFAVLADKYYKGKDSAFFEKVLSKNLTGLKEPIMISDLFVNF